MKFLLNGKILSPPELSTRISNEIWGFFCFFLSFHFSFFVLQKFCVSRLNTEWLITIIGSLWNYEKNCEWNLNNLIFTSLIFNEFFLLKSERKQASCHEKSQQKFESHNFSIHKFSKGTSHRLWFCLHKTSKYEILKINVFLMTLIM